MESTFHFSQVFKLEVPEQDLEFFDVNLQYDTPLFIDLFLLKVAVIKAIGNYLKDIAYSSNLRSKNFKKLT